MAKWTKARRIAWSQNRKAYFAAAKRAKKTEPPSVVTTSVSSLINDPIVIERVCDFVWEQLTVEDKVGLIMNELNGRE